MRFFAGDNTFEYWPMELRADLFPLYICVVIVMGCVTVIHKYSFLIINIPAPPGLI